MRTKRPTTKFVMLGERDAKNYRIKKNEMYTLREFVNKINPVMTGKPSLLDRVFKWDKIKDSANIGYKGTLFQTLNGLIERDIAGRKRK